MKTRLSDSAPQPEVETAFPSHAVCVETNGGWIYIAEFRTQREAMFIAQTTFIRTGMTTRVMDGTEEVWCS